MSLKSYTLSLKNSQVDKPNEDYFVADDRHGIYIVADGVTSTPRSGEQYPNPSGGQLAARAFCEEAYQHLVACKKELEAEPAAVLKGALNLANRKIHALNQTYNRYAEANFIDKDYFGTVATVVVAVKAQFHILHVGDTMVLLQSGTTLELLADIQTRNVAEYEKKVKDNGSMPSGELTVAIRRDFRNHINARGLSGERVAYGVFTGEEEVADFIQAYEAPAQPGDRLLILSDGFEPLIDHVLNDAESMQTFCELLNEPSVALEWMIEQNRRLEKRSDDKTAIIVEVDG